MASFGLLTGLLVPLFAVPFLGGGAMILAGFIVILRQIVGWLHTGNWSPMEFRAAWHAVGTEPDLPDLGVSRRFWCGFLISP
jgi:hypothetical protein